LLAAAVVTMVLLAGAAPVGAAPGAGIRGVVFFDADGDGAQGPGERGLADVTVFLTGPGADRTEVTDSDGVYEFLGLSPGAYTVTETDPAGYLSTTSNGAVITLALNEVRDDVSFGDALPVTLTGVVFEDADLDGQQAFWEEGVPGAEVALYPDEDRDGVQDPGAPPVETTTTLDDGGYIIGNLLPAWYVVVVDAPPGYVNTTPNVLPVILVSGEATGAQAPPVGMAPQAPTAVTLVGFAGRSGSAAQPGETLVWLLAGSGLVMGALILRHR